MLMRNLSWSFAPDGSHFIFDIDTGETLKQGIKHHRQARAEWIRLRGV
jgi:hypothetical protein